MINKGVIIRMTEQLRQAAEAEAAKNGINLSAFIRMLIVKEVYKKKPLK